ncbi:MAG: cation:proton antiporter [Ardenticatenaceae bacterium]|nr:cation:proton antiporter [Ardenticatenaceae bacterium]
MESETISFIPLLTVIFLAFIVPLVLSRFKRIRLPIVVGEILAGIIIGGSGFGLIQQHDPVLDLLAEFGFAFLFFLGGMEIDFSSLSLPPGRGQTLNRRQKLTGPLPLGLLAFGLTLLMSLVIALALVQVGFVSNLWIMALIFAPSSLGIIFAVLKESGHNSGRFGQSILVAAIVADFGTVLLLTVLVAALSRGLTLEILLVGIIFIAFLLIYRFTGFLERVWPVRRTLDELSSATAQIKIRVAFTILLTFVVLAEILGAELVLGAFLAGAMLSLLARPEDKDTLHQLEAIGFGFFIPIFFIMIGVDFDISALLESPQALLLVPILLVAAFAVKMVPALLFRFVFSWRETISAGILLSTRLSLIIAEAAIALRLGLIDEAVNADIILVAMLLATAAPLIFNRIAPPRTEGSKPPLFVVAGATTLGLQVAQQLRGHLEQVLIIDPDPARIQAAQSQGFQTLQAATDREDPQASPYLNQAYTLIDTHSNPERSYLTCKLARTLHGIEHVIAPATEPMQLRRFEQLGVKTLNLALDQAAFLTLMARNPSMFELLTRVDDDKEVYEVTIRNAEHVGRRLRDLHLPGDVLVLAVQRENELIVPHGNTRLAYGDHISLIGSLACLDEALRLFAGS